MGCEQFCRDRTPWKKEPVARFQLAPCILSYLFPECVQRFQDFSHALKRRSQANIPHPIQGGVDEQEVRANSAKVV